MVTALDTAMKRMDAFNQEKVTRSWSGVGKHDFHPRCGPLGGLCREARVRSVCPRGSKPSGLVCCNVLQAHRALSRLVCLGST